MGNYRARCVDTQPAEPILRRISGPTPLIKTGENVRDGQGNSYQLGQLLGRGLWGKSYVVRRESDESLHILKMALSPDDFRGEVPGADAFFAMCREAVLEQARLYEEAAFPFLPRLESRFILPDGQPALVLPRYPESLERRLGDTLPLGALVETLVGVVRHLRELASGPGLHGDLRPSNILFNDRGEIVLTDLATPAVRKHFVRLATTVPGGQPFLPPELADVAGATWGAGADTYALAMILWRGIVATEARPPWPRAGLDKAAQVALKDAVVERMKLEDSNPRFHARLAERVAVLLSRALSKEVSPSPPYRFPRLDELQARLEEVQVLIRPQVGSVGKIMLDRSAAKPWFTTDEEVGFSTTVGCTAGVEGQEEIGVGVAVFDLDRDVRMKDLALGYTVDRHPSGRYRFTFSIGGLAPGRYRTRLAFAIRDSGHPPATSESEFNVRAAPGWVPRAEPPVPSALPLRPDPITVTQAAPLPPSEPTRVLGTAPGRPEPAPAAAPEAPRAPARPTPPAGGPAPHTTPPPSPAPRPPIVTRERPTSDDRSLTAVAATELPSGLLSAMPAPIPPGDPTRWSLPLAEAPAEVLADPLAEAAASSSEATPPPVVTRSPAPARPAPPVEPPWRAKSWSEEALPMSTSGRDLESDDQAPAPNDEDEDFEAGPNPLDRIWHQLRNDPYIAVMAGLGLIILVLLLVFLLLRK